MSLNCWFNMAGSELQMVFRLQDQDSKRDGENGRFRCDIFIVMGFGIADSAGHNKTAADHSAAVLVENSKRWIYTSTQMFPFLWLVTQAAINFMPATPSSIVGKV